MTDKPATCTFRLSPALMRWLKAYAAREGTSIQALLIAAIERLRKGKRDA